MARRRLTVTVFADPTPERLRHAVAWTVGNARDRRDRTVTILDPFTHAFHRGVFSPGQYDAGQKFRLHWDRGGLKGALANPRLELGFGNVFTDRADGLPRSEAEERHRAQYRTAVRLVGPSPQS
jgi:hypothetical protein